MKDKKYFLSTILAAELAVLMMAAVIIRTFVPAWILPKAEVSNFVLVSLIAVFINHYVAKETKPCYLSAAVFSAVSFGLLPLAAGYIPIEQAFWCGCTGGVIFTLVTVLFSSFKDRLSTGPTKKMAPLLSAVGIYLASLGFMGIF